MTTQTTASQAPARRATKPTRETWGQHGQPEGGFQFYGTAVKAPAAEPVEVARVEVGTKAVTLKDTSGQPVTGGTFSKGTKFWAVVPKAAKRQAAPKAKAEPVVINAPKGSTQTVAPRKGAIKAAIAATGKSIQQIAREHGQNPSQLRRLAADAVAKVDLVRAESIATALGAKMADLFGAPEDKTTKAAPKATARHSRASRAAEATAQDAAKAE